jgi:hypothetical protein
MKMVTGFPQGDPNGPPLYGAGYSGVLDETDELKNERNIDTNLQFQYSAKVGVGIGITEPIDVGRTMFVDDQLEITEIRNP